MVCLIYSGKLGVPLELQWGSQGTSQGSQVSFRVARWSIVLLLSHCRGIGPHLTLKGGSCDVSRIAVGSFVFSLVATVSPGNFSCCLREVRPPFKLPLALRIAFQ